MKQIQESCQIHDYLCLSKINSITIPRYLLSTCWLSSVLADYDHVIARWEIEIPSFMLFEILKYFCF